MLDQHDLTVLPSCPPPLLCRVHFALSCKALLRQYRQDEAAWLRGLHVSLACSGSKQDVAACNQRLQRLLQRLPCGSIFSLALMLTDPPCSPDDLLGLLPSVSESLAQLELQLNDYISRTTPQGLSLPLLRRAMLRSNGTLPNHSCIWSFSLAPLLESLTLGSGILQHLPPALTHLELHNVCVLKTAAAAVLSGRPSAVYRMACQARDVLR